MNYKIKREIEQAFREGYKKGYKEADKSLLIKSLKSIADHYGFTAQADMLCEESAEFIVALNKFQRGKAEAYSNVKEELADVLVIALQLRLLLGEKDIDDIMSEKVFRQLERIRKEQKNEQ